MLFALLAACGHDAPERAAPERAAPSDDPRVARFEDLDPLLGTWPMRAGDNVCAGDRGFELVKSKSAFTGYGLVDRTADSPVMYDVTGDRKGEDGILRMSLQSGPTGPVEKIELAFDGDVVKVTWTQPPRDPFELVTPEGAKSRSAVVCP